MDEPSKEALAAAIDIGVHVAECLAEHGAVDVESTAPLWAQFVDRHFAPLIRDKWEMGSMDELEPLIFRDEHEPLDDALRRLLQERDALRAEVERLSARDRDADFFEERCHKLRAVVEAARAWALMNPSDYSGAEWAAAQLEAFEAVDTAIAELDEGNHG